MRHAKKYVSRAKIEEEKIVCDVNEFLSEFHKLGHVQTPMRSIFSSPSPSSSCRWKVKAKEAKLMNGGTLWQNKLSCPMNNSNAPNPLPKKQFLIKIELFLLHCLPRFVSCVFLPSSSSCDTKRNSSFVAYSLVKIDQVLIKFYASLGFFSAAHSSTPIEFPLNKKGQN